MADSSMGLHEDRGDLRPATLERHRGLVSLMEELEAIDWYQQRIDATGDRELRDVLAHNRDEEAEHAAMSLEWLRRNDPALDRQLRAYLFTEGSIAAEEDEAQGRGETAAERGDGSLGIGGLSGRDRA
ncbi:MAG: encapsulin-associated ferritin-like protein [Thermoleophilia bacterium]